MALTKPLPDAKLPLWIGGQSPAQYYVEYWLQLDAQVRGNSNLSGTFETLGELAGINLQLASYVLVLTDKGKTIEMNVAGANTLTIPPNSSVAFPIKAYLNLAQVGAGQTTITPGVGVAIHARNGLKTAGQWALATFYQRATDEWIAAGDLTP